MGHVFIVIGWSGTNQWAGIIQIIKVYNFIGLNNNKKKNQHVISIPMDAGSEAVNQQWWIWVFSYNTVSQSVWQCTNKYIFLL